MTVKTRNALYLSVPPQGLGDELVRLIGSVEPSTEIRIEAAGLTFIRPLELCLLRALIDRAAEVGEVVLFEPPYSADLQRYLVSMDLYEGRPRNVTVTREIPTVRHRDKSDALIELVRIGSAADVERLMHRVRRVTKRVGPPSIAGACAVAITEACGNVVDHASSPTGGLVAAQLYPSSSGLELAVVDMGIGIHSSLAANPSYRNLSDLDAIVRALEPGVSAITDDPGRGLGLPSLVTAAAGVEEAALHIRSGQAELRLTWSPSGEHRLVLERSAPGTAIWLRLKAK